jgi:hypothetical protein
MTFQYEELSELGEQVQELFTKAADKIAKLTGWKKRESKLSPTIFSLTMVLGLMKNPKSSLVDLVRFCEKITKGSIKITPQSLDERISPNAVEMLKKLFQDSMTRFKQRYKLELEVMKNFTAVNIVDSSFLTLPEALSEEFPGNGGSNSKASIKIQLLYEFLTGRYSSIQLYPGRCADQKYGPEVASSIAAGSLMLMDLGYFALKMFEIIIERKAYFVSRLLLLTGLSENRGGKAGNSIDLAGLLRRANTAFEFDAFLGKAQRVSCRVICIPTSAQVTAERRRKLKKNAKKEGRTPSQKNLEMADWSIFITNVDRTLLTTKMVAELYRVRWAIELTFKLWKSHYELDNVGGMRKERILSQLYAKLIGLTLFQSLVWPMRYFAFKNLTRDLSLVKALRVVRDLALELACAIKGCLCLDPLLYDCTSQFISYCLMERRNSSSRMLSRFNFLNSLHLDSFFLPDPCQVLLLADNKLSIFPYFLSFDKVP